jgi:hypothetical protein
LAELERPVSGTLFQDIFESTEDVGLGGDGLEGKVVGDEVGWQERRSGER